MSKTETSIVDECSKLEASLEARTKELAVSQAKAADLEKQLAESRAECAAKQHQLAEAMQKVQALEKQLADERAKSRKPEPEIKPMTNGFLQFVGKPFVIRSVADKSFVLDTGGHQNGGGPIKIWKHAGAGHANQTWTADAMGRLISWQNRNSILQIPDPSNGKMPTIVGMKGNSAANDPTSWWIFDEGVIRSVKNPQQVLDVKAGMIENGTPVLTWACHNGVNQRWEIEMVKPKI